MTQIIATILALVIGLTLHEWAHAYVANLLGDPTARLQGRVSFDPRKHFDPLGTLMMIYSGLTGIGFGWGKPVPVNIYNFKNPNRDEFLVAMAGPAMNFFIALVISLILKADLISSVFWIKVLSQTMFLNLGLLVFNLIPLPPLDGSKILGILFPTTWRNYRQQIEQYGGIILLVMVLLLKDILWLMLLPLFKLFLWILGVQ